MSKKPVNKFLVTGGAGFIGSHLCRRLLRDNHFVYVIDNLSTGRLSNIAPIKHHPNFRFINLDLTNYVYEKTIRDIINSIDIVFHLAASVGVQNVYQNRLSSICNNKTISSLIIDQCVKSNKILLFTSSSEVYHHCFDFPLREDMNISCSPLFSPREAYAMCKLLDEIQIITACREFGLKGIVARLFNCIGQHQSGQYGMVVPRFIHRAKNNTPIEVYGNGKQTRTFCYIDDIIDVFMLMISQTSCFGEVFNIGSEEEISIKELAFTIKKLIKSSSPVVYVQPKSIMGNYFLETERRVPDCSKIHKFCNWSSSKSLKNTLRIIIEERNYD